MIARARSKRRRVGIGGEFSCSTESCASIERWRTHETDCPESYEPSGDGRQRSGANCLGRLVGVLPNTFHSLVEHRVRLI